MLTNENKIWPQWQLQKHHPGETTRTCSDLVSAKQGTNPSKRFAVGRDFIKRSHGPRFLLCCRAGGGGTWRQDQVQKLDWWGLRPRVPAAILTITPSTSGCPTGDTTRHTLQLPGPSSQRPEGVPEKSQSTSVLDLQPKLLGTQCWVFMAWLPVLAVHSNPPGQLLVTPGSPYTPQG